jgi:outer membrane protein TolC
MVLKKRLFVATVFFVSVASAAESPRSLTWVDCVHLAADRNPQLLSAILAQEASRAQYYGSYNGIFPHLSLLHSYTDSWASGLGESKSWQAQGALSLDLLDLNQWATIQASAATLRLNQANQEVASANVLLNLYRAFATLLYTQEEIDVNKSIRDLWDENAQMIALRYDSGAESKGNNMQTQAQFLQADVAVTQAARDLQVAQQQLAQALGQDDFLTLVVTGTWSAARAPQNPPDLNALVDHLPSILAQKAVVDQAKAAVHAAQSSVFPTLSLNYNKGVAGGSEFPSSPFWTFSGLLSYPLFGGGPTATYYAVSAANKSYQKALQDLNTARQQAFGILESAWDGFAQAEDQVRVQRAFLDADIQRKQEADIMYQSGLMTFQDWQVITNDYVNFQKSYLSAEQNLIAAEGQWQFATGQQLGETQ